MNIFFLHVDASTCVKYYFNKHCVKIILEITQVLYTAHHINPSCSTWIVDHQQLLQLQPYRKTHYNHPISKWIRNCKKNYDYACLLGLQLCCEYTRRYKKIHKCQERLQWLSDNFPCFFNNELFTSFMATKNVPTGCSVVPLCMPEKYHQEDLIQAYRDYYLAEKSHIADKLITIEYLHQEWKE